MLSRLLFSVSQSELASSKNWTCTHTWSENKWYWFCPKYDWELLPWIKAIFFQLRSTLIITSRFQEHLSCEKTKTSPHTSEHERQRERFGAFSCNIYPSGAGEESHFRAGSGWQERHWCVQPLGKAHNDRLGWTQMNTRETQLCRLVLVPGRTGVLLFGDRFV